MPAARSSRRSAPGNRGHREPSSDRIEEDTNPSQSQAVDEVDEAEQDGPGEEEEEPRVRPRGQTVKPEEAGSDAESEDDGEQIDIANFNDQALERQDAQRLKGMSQDWLAVRSGMEKSAFAMLAGVGSGAAEVAAEEGKEGIQMLENLETLAREMVDQEEEMRAHENALDDLYQSVTRGDQITDVKARWKSGFAEKKDAYSKKTTRQKLAKHGNYFKYRQAIFEVQHSGEAMPPLVDLLAKEDGDDSDDEEDIQIGGVTQDFKCPLTLVPLVNPMTSRKCGHSFNADAIRAFLGPRAEVTKPCPAAGCNMQICMNDMAEDRELERRVRAAERRGRRVVDSDDDNAEVVE